MYADLCRKMVDQWAQVELVDAAEKDAKADAESDAALAGDEGKSESRTKGAMFKVLLLERCQKEFEKNRGELLQEINELVRDLMHTVLKYQSMLHGTRTKL